MGRVGMGALAALLLMPLGCDKRAVTPGSASPAEAASASGREPVSADSPKNFPLLIMPLSVSLPADWRLDPPVEPSFLEGPAPSGELEISLSLMDAMDDRQQQYFIAGAIDESQYHPLRIHVRQFTNKSGLSILERVTYAALPGHGRTAPPTTAPTTAPTAAPTTLPSQLLSCDYIVFVPYKHKFLPCSFDLIGLTELQYELDQPLIRTMIDTAEKNETPAFQ